MKRGKKILFSLMGGLALTATSKAVVNDSPAAGTSSDPYEAIWLRNVFALKPIEPDKPQEVAAPQAPPPNVHLTGIITLFGKKQALFMVQDPAAPGKPPEKERSYRLSENERRDRLEVLEIDVKNRKVKIKLEDLVSTITFETNRPSAAPQLAGGAPGQFQPPAGMNVGFPQQRQNPGGFPAPGFQKQQPQPGQQPGLSPAGGVTPQGLNVPVANNNQNMSSEEATALFLLHNTAHQAEIDAGTYPPPPPIPGLNTGSKDPSQTAAANNNSSSPPELPTVPSGSRGTGTLRNFAAGNQSGGGPPPPP